MKYFIILAYIIISSAQTFSQSEKKYSLFLNAQYNTTIYDRVKPNNSKGLGGGLAVFYNFSSTYKISLDLNCDVFTGNKVLYRTPEDKELVGKDLVPMV